MPRVIRLRHDRNAVRGVCMPIDIRRLQVQQMAQAGAQLVEVLPTKEYEQEHLPGAINIPLKQLDRNTTAPLDRDRPVIVYCHNYL
jgi:rhodanese-related sulfurtransferase